MVINTRKGLKNNFEKFSIETIRALKVQVVINNYEVGNLEQAEYRIEHAASVEDVGGVFNLAMVLNHALFETQSAESFEEVYKPKVNVTLNMDAISRKMCPNVRVLRYFFISGQLSRKCWTNELCLANHTVGRYWRCGRYCRTYGRK